MERNISYYLTEPESDATEAKSTESGEGLTTPVSVTTLVPEGKNESATRTTVSGESTTNKSKKKKHKKKYFFEGHFGGGKDDDD